MKISLITPTYNRCDWLNDTIASILNQKTSGAEIEYLVVDNNSKDSTREIIETYAAKETDIDVRYVFENSQGINHARNAGIRNATGDYLIFFDDDILLDEGCIQYYIDAFKTFPREIVFGGKVLLRQPDFSIPAWLALDGSYARSMIIPTSNFGDATIRLSLQKNIPLGAHMGFRRDVFGQFGMFRTDVGLTGDKLMPGAEYELFNRLLRNNIDFWIYVGESVVYHPLKEEQAKKQYFRKRLMGVGRVTYRMHKFEAKKTLFGLPLYLPANVVKNYVRSLKYKLLGKPVESFFYETEAYLNFGCIREHFSGKQQYP